MYKKGTLQPVMINDFEWQWLTLNDSDYNDNLC